MAETKTKVALESQGWKIGDKAFNASVSFSNQDEPYVEGHGVGLFRTKRGAKAAVERELARLTPTEIRDGWWGGDVETGSIVDESFRDGTYGYVSDWSFEHDERTETIWKHAGLAWNE